MTVAVLPELPLSAWEPTKDTLHLWVQIVGKVRMATVPPQNHWWHVPLYVDVDGLTTGPMRRGGTTFQIRFDLHDHALRVEAADGRGGAFALRDGLSVAAFDARLHALLRSLGVDVAIDERPYGVPMTIPFPDDDAHDAYDPDAVRRFWRALAWVDDVLCEFAGWYCGKRSPVHLFWHSLDLAHTRFSGRVAPPLPEADPVTREAYSHEVISFGFWAGDRELREAAFYSYANPAPDGLAAATLRPRGVRWLEQPGGPLALLPYEAVRRASDPRRTLLAFLHSAYEAGGRAAGWDRAALRSSCAPSERELAELIAVEPLDRSRP